jgi:hypothetical protein
MPALLGHASHTFHATSSQGVTSMITRNYNLSCVTTSSLITVLCIGAVMHTEVPKTSIKTCCYAFFKTMQKWPAPAEFCWNLIEDFGKILLLQQNSLECICVHSLACIAPSKLYLKQVASQPPRIVLVEPHCTGQLRMAMTLLSGGCWRGMTSK